MILFRRRAWAVRLAGVLSAIGIVAGLAWLLLPRLSGGPHFAAAMYGQWVEQALPAAREALKR